MQKQYVISPTAPAIDIALELAHQQFVPGPSPSRRRGSHQLQDFPLETTPRPCPVYPSARRRCRLADDPGGAHPINFFVILFAGLVMLACGTIAVSVWLTMTGFLVTLVGTLLQGWSLCDERQLNSARVGGE